MCSSRHDGADTATNGLLYSDTAGLGYWISRSCPTQRSKNRDSYGSSYLCKLYNWYFERNVDDQDKQLELERMAKTNKLLHCFLTTTITTDV